MALTRKFLTALGIEPEKVDEIISAHAETVDALKSEISEMNGSATQSAKLQAELDELKASMESGDKWQEKYEQVKKDFADYKTQIETEKLNEQKIELYRQLLIDNNIDKARIPSILKVTNVDELEVSDGVLAEVEKLAEQINADYAGFIVKERTDGAQVDTPPVSNVSQTGREEFEKMSLAEKMAYANEHPDEVAKYW